MKMEVLRFTKFLTGLEAYLLIDHSQSFKKVFSIESAAYVLAFVVAIFFRFVLLDQPSLNNTEASYALQAFVFARGEEVLIGSQPGYIALTSLMFSIFAAGNFWARFWPALFGSAFTLTPIFFRQYLGKAPGVILAFLIAFDAGMITLSRTGGSSIIAIATLIAGFGFYLNRKWVLSSLSWGIALVGGLEVWPGLLILALTIITVRPGKIIDQDAENLAPSPKTDWKLLVIPGVILAIILSTQFMLHPNGISGFGSSIAAFFESYSKNDGIGIGNFIVLTFCLQFPLLILVFFEMVRGINKKSRITWFLTIWWALAFLLVLVNPSRSGILLGWTEIPLLALSAMTVTRVIEKAKLENRLLCVGQTLLTILMLGLSFYYLMNVTISPEADPILFRNKIIAVLLPLILLIIVTILFAWGWNSTSARRGTSLGITILLSMMIISSGWKATGWGNETKQELWRGEQVTVGDTILLTTIEDLSHWSTGQNNRIDIEIAEINSPSLLWALRDFEKLTVSEHLNLNTTSSILITPDIDTVQAGLPYRGQKVLWSSQPDILNMNFWNWLKWIVYRESQPASSEILLWARNDLFKGSTSK
jgi:hypothetical protein